MPRARATRQYLERYAAAEAAAADAIEKGYERVIAIPLKRESPSFLDGLAPALPGAGRVLAIAVINAEVDAPEATHRQNAELFRALAARARVLSPVAPAVTRAALPSPGELELLIVDRFSPGRRLPRKGGVGLARKIAFDIALALRHRGLVASRWIHTTDADAVLPADYFEAADAAPRDAAGLTYPLWHETSDSEEGSAIALYEISLRYYVLGLAAAGSPYAFHTLGSALAADADAYAAARGVPVREAAEDFYLLGKLAKIAPVARARAAPIGLRERLSERVPVGTGPAALRIARDLARGEPFRLYHPLVFAALRRLHCATERFIQTRDPAFLTPAATSRGELRLDAAYRHAMTAIGAPEAFERAAAATTSPEALARRVHGWLDGFRTLKFIRAAEKAGLSPLPWRKALESAEFLSDRLDTGSSVRAIRTALAEAETRRRY